jgi:superfamily II DNA or RNA helicase
MDFDKGTWKEDIAVVRSICKTYDIPVYAERSRSGDGCHLWFFFEEDIKASLARKFGMTILSLAMQKSDNIHFDSYDRLFPSQDFLQKEGFGNLIALPLQKEARLNHNSVFISDDLNEIEDQWHYLSNVLKIKEGFIEYFIKSHKIVNVLSDVDYAKESQFQASKGDFPNELILERSNGIVIKKQGISAKGLYSLRMLSSYANPEFYAKQAMRQSTFGTPRVTAVFTENEQEIVLPRGVESKLFDILNSTSVKYSVINNRHVGNPLNIYFNGQLNLKQEIAFTELNKFDDGVLSATTGFGKTVIGARIIAEKKVPTLILVHTKELATQWKERLEQFLTINETVEKKSRKKSSVIGQLGGGKNSINGIVDIAIMQSMFDKDKEVKSIINQYGLILVDECHHISAVNFSRILAAANSKYVYGLTATPIRKDGHQNIVFMLCGNIRHKVDAKQEAKLRDFKQYITPRFTSTRMPLYKRSDEWHITEVYKHICDSITRNELIVNDVIQAINNGRNPLILTERTSHLEMLAALMKAMDFQVITISGDLKTKIRKEALSKIKSLKDGERFVIVATGKLIGEGFDESRLDTLFMAMPIAWKGTIAQYAGRLHRNYDGKKEVIIYDYVDVHIPVLERMYHKRLSAYRSIGYNIKTNSENTDTFSVIYNESDYFQNVVNDIENAQKSVVISCSYVQKKKLDPIKDLLLEKYQSGVRITICLKNLEDYQDTQRGYISKFARVVTNMGINVIQVPQNRYKFMIIDNKFVWYGGIDILGRSFEDSTLIRIENEELANELIGMIAIKN